MPARRYYARRYYNRKRKWTRIQMRNTINFVAVNSSTFSSREFAVMYTYNNTNAAAYAYPNGSTRLKVKNIKVQCSLFDSNAGEFWLISLCYVPNGSSAAITQDNQSMNQIGAKEYTYLNPDCVLAQKKITVNDYDSSNVTLYTRLARWIDPGAALRLIVTHGTDSLTETTNAGSVAFFCTYYVTDS